MYPVLVTGTFKMWIFHSEMWILYWVFRHLRELFQVDPADYMLAICGNDALRELSSPGKSGSFFYLTQDDRFMIKTVKKSEVKVCCLPHCICEFGKTMLFRIMKIVYFV